METQDDHSRLQIWLSTRALYCTKSHTPARVPSCHPSYSGIAEAADAYPQRYFRHGLGVINLTQSKHTFRQCSSRYHRISQGEAPASGPLVLPSYAGVRVGNDVTADLLAVKLSKLSVLRRPRGWRGMSGTPRQDLDYHTELDRAE